MSKPKRQTKREKEVAKKVTEAMEAVASQSPSELLDQPMIATPFALEDLSEGPPLMKFGNPVWKPGLNVTVRQGTKWAETRGTVFATTVLGLPVTPIEVVETLVLEFEELKPAPERSRSLLLAFEQNPGCRNYFALLKEMRSVYSDFNPQAEVTMVFFLVAE